MSDYIVHYTYIDRRSSSPYAVIKGECWIGGVRNEKHAVLKFRNYFSNYGREGKPTIDKIVED